MEDWLFKDENYIPKKDSDKFIDKSIIMFIKLLATISGMNKYKEIRFIYKVNPILKVILTLASIVMIALTRSFAFVVAAILLMFLICNLMDHENRKKVYAISLILPLLTIIMLIPSMLMGNYKNCLLIVLKVTGTISSANILSYTTKWHHLTKALKLFFIPDIFIFVIDITFKYIYLLGEYSLEMLYALKLRSVGKNDKKYTSVPRLGGNLFLKSKEAGDEMYAAMECRGFVGEYEVNKDFKLIKEDYLYLMIYFLFAASYIFLK